MPFDTPAAELPPLTKAQQQAHDAARALLLKIAAALPAARDFDAAVIEVEREREITAVTGADFDLRLIVRGVRTWLDEAGISAPRVEGLS